jgi:tRNA modification GTPase
MKESTICAIASPPGQGAISLIRVSGPETFTICGGIIPNKKVSSLHPNTIHLCKISDKGFIIDEVLISIFKTPHSYTGEDLIEISCHGSTYIQQKIMELLVKEGACLAKPGEFTMRAFLNGKLDLSQAEAVADLIHSSSKAGHDAAIHQMRGGFSKEIATLREQLLSFASLVELELDFSEEDVEFANRNDLKNNVLKIQSVVEKLINSFQYGNIIKNGVPVAIVGSPNVGKSTLLNSLINEEKSIVSEIPGTTRDIIEDIINIDGIAFRFIDTAGIRHTTDILENLGIERTLENVRKASVVLLIIEPYETSDNIIQQINSLTLVKEQKLAIIINKIDKVENNHNLYYLNSVKEISKFQVISVSAKNKENLDKIHQFLIETAKDRKLNDNDIVVTNLRHLEALQHTHSAGVLVIEGLETKLPGDLLAQDLREMLNHLGSITGEITTDEVLGNIFKNFCIGK